MKNLKSLLCPLFFSLLMSLAGCHYSSNEGPSDLASIQIIDRNGISETVSSKDRLQAYSHTDFLTSQPYQKVTRLYGRDEKGNFHSQITSYHPNGSVKQYLEAVNHRAFGTYKEWYPNCQLKIDAIIIGGIADLHTQAEQSWLFEGVTKAWNEEGQLIAEIPYVKGELSGTAHYYHNNAKLWKELTYKKNLLEGITSIYLEDGSLFQTTPYKEGLKEGKSLRFWEDQQIAYKEVYSADSLLQGDYFDREGHLVALIREGHGERALFGRYFLEQMQEYRFGKQEGIVKIFAPSGQVVATYSLKEGEKEGEEIEYFVDSHQKTKLLMTWHKGILQGPVKTWYSNGQLESSKEMSQNNKQGIATVWYPDGSLMIVEHYDENRLVKGEYFRPGESSPAGQIQQGEGVALLFDQSGHLIQKVSYHDGFPQV